MPKDDALIAELTAPTYTFTPTGKLVVESKADMKKRGMRSPDLADAFLLNIRLWREAQGAIPEAGATQLLSMGRVVLKLAIRRGSLNFFKPY